MTIEETLPEPGLLRKQMIIQAALDTILCEEDYLRYHSFDPSWSPNVSLAKIDNGAGDHLFILFAPEGAMLKGFDHESELSPYANDEEETDPGIYEKVPSVLVHLLEDAALERDVVTFCIWRETGDTSWKKGNAEVSEQVDGSSFLIGAIFQTAEDYVEFAEGYYEQELPIAIISQIYQGHPITAEMIQTLNPERDVEEALNELALLGL
jgi:hypothetical protein